jgi:RNA polymerase sigma factor for flagellar operon FliA
LGRSPSEVELAAGLGVELSEYYGMIDDVSSTALLSLDDVTHGEDDDRPVPLVDTLKSQESSTALTKLEAQELRNLLADSIGQLTEQERLVVALYYYEELTLKEIGLVLELSESRVSQLHTKAVLSLRVKLRKRFMA